MAKPIKLDELQAFGWLLHAAGLGVTCAIVMGASALLFGPINHRTQLADNEIQSTGDYLEEKPAIVARHQQLETQLTNRQQRQSDLIARIPDSARESEFLTQLSQLARSTGMAITRYNPGETIEEGNHASLEIELKARASYESICRFLTSLEDLPRLCRVTQLNIIAPELNGDTYPVDLTLQIFFTTGAAASGSEVTNG